MQKPGMSAASGGLFRGAGLGQKVLCARACVSTSSSEYGCLCVCTFKEEVFVCLFTRVPEGA